MPRQRSYPRISQGGRDWLKLHTDSIHAVATQKGQRLVAFPDFDNTKRLYAKVIELYWNYRYQIQLQVFGDDWCVPDETSLVLKYPGLCRRAQIEADILGQRILDHYNRKENQTC